MILGAGEYRGREHNRQPRETDDVPNDARAVRAGGDGLVAQLVHVDRADGALVLLEHSLQRAVEAIHVPDAHLALAPAAQQLLAVFGHGDGRHALVVAVVYRIQQPSSLGREYAYVAVVPRCDNLRTVEREQHAGAREIPHGDPEQFLERVHGPHAHVVLASRREHLAVVVRERQIVYDRRVAREQAGDVEVVRPHDKQFTVHRAHQYGRVVLH